MPTNIELKKLYKEDWKTLEPLSDRIKSVYRTRTTSKLSRENLQTIKSVHDRYYPKDKGKLTGCGKCIMKMVDRVYKMIIKEEPNDE